VKVPELEAEVLAVVPLRIHELFGTEEELVDLFRDPGEGLEVNSMIRGKLNG
jgi:hypothetical protein